jgi:hypothetical protein
MELRKAILISLIPRFVLLLKLIGQSKDLQRNVLIITLAKYRYHYADNSEQVEPSLYIVGIYWKSNYEVNYMDAT